MTADSASIHAGSRHSFATTRSSSSHPDEHGLPPRPSFWNRFRSKEQQQQQQHRQQRSSSQIPWSPGSTVSPAPQGMLLQQPTTEVMTGRTSTISKHQHLSSRDNNNNNPHHATFTQTAQQPSTMTISTTTTMTRRSSPQQHNCCTRCCSGLGWCCCCCGLWSCCWNTLCCPPLQQRTGSNSSRRPVSTCIFLGLALITFSALYRFSSRGNHAHWSLNAGESRRVTTAGFLTDTVQVISSTTTTTNADAASTGVSVYAIPTCPPLSGPTVTLQDQQDLVLMHNAYEYQYFYLNQGSTFDLTIAQTAPPLPRGTTSANIFVLRGHKVLARVSGEEGGSSDIIFPQQIEDPNSLRVLQENTNNNNSILVEHWSIPEDASSSSSSSSSSSLSSIHFSFTSPANDVYVLMYDNAAGFRQVELTVGYRITLTTYDLHGLTPWCSHSSVEATAKYYVQDDDYKQGGDRTVRGPSFSCPPIDVSQAGCIVVQAKPQIPMPVQRNVERFGHAVVDVTIETTRKWLWIGVLSLLPSCMWILWIQRRRQHGTYQRRRGRSVRHHVHHEQDGYQYLLYHEDLDDGEHEEEDTAVPVQQEPTTNQEPADVETPSSPPRQHPPETQVAEPQATAATSASAENEQEEEQVTTIPAENVIVLDKRH